MKELYPLTICKDRYNGTYSGGKWLAFNSNPHQVPIEPFMDDMTAGTFDYSEVGAGHTKQEAIENLKAKQ